MQTFPHHYSVAAHSEAQGDVALEGDRLPTIESAPPVEFGGPGDRWSPETLLVAAVADCFHPHVPGDCGRLQVFVELTHV